MEKYKFIYLFMDTPGVLLYSVEVLIDVDNIPGYSFFCDR